MLMARTLSASVFKVSLLKTNYQLISEPRMWGRLLTCAQIANRRSGGVTTRRRMASCPTSRIMTTQNLGDFRTLHLGCPSQRLGPRFGTRLIHGRTASQQQLNHFPVSPTAGPAQRRRLQQVVPQV